MSLDRRDQDGRGFGERGQRCVGQKWKQRERGRTQTNDMLEELGTTRAVPSASWHSRAASLSQTVKSKAPYKVLQKPLLP